MPPSLEVDVLSLEVDALSLEVDAPYPVDRRAACSSVTVPFFRLYRCALVCTTAPSRGRNVEQLGKLLCGQFLHSIYLKYKPKKRVKIIREKSHILQGTIPVGCLQSTC